MSYMFDGCSSLTNIDVSGFRTSNVTGMRGMFSGCRDLTSVDLSKFDTRNVTSMEDMFFNCRNLISIDISGFDATRVRDMRGMFDGCSSLKILKMPANLAMEVELPGTGWKDENGIAVSSAAVLSIPMTYTRTLGGSNPPIQDPPFGTASVGETVTDQKTGGKYTVLSADTVFYAGPMKQAKNIVVPDTVTTEKGVFTVTEIAENAFKGNKKVASITIGKNVMKIGKNAFSGCKNLKKIIIKTKKLQSVGANALKGIHKNCKIKVPAAKIRDYQKKFKKKGQKASVKVIK